MRSRATLLLAAVGLAFAGRPAAAQVSGSWNADTSAAWNVGPWLGGVPSGGGTATFAFPITAARTATFDTAYTLGGVNFTATGTGSGYTIAGTAANNLTTLASGATLTYGSVGVNTISAPTTLGGVLTVTGTTYGNQVVSGVVSGSGSLLVNTAVLTPMNGSVQLQTTNTYAGGTTLQSGVLRLLNPNATATPSTLADSLGTGTVTASGGTLQTGGTYTHSLSNTFSLPSDLIVGSTGGGGLTLSGPVGGATDAGGLSLRSLGSPLTLTGANNLYTGPTVVRQNVTDSGNTPSNAGLLSFAGSATMPNSPSFAASAGGAVRFDSGTLPTLIQKTGAAAPVTLAGGGVQVVGGTNTGAGGVQQFGALTGSGYSMVTGLSASLGSGQGVTLAFSSLSRGAAGTGTFLFSGGGAVPAGTTTSGTTTGTLGGPAATSVQRVTFGTAPALVGGILPYAVGGVSGSYTFTAGAAGPPVTPQSLTVTGGAGEGLVTYDADGVRLLTAGEYTPDVASGGNVRLTAAAANTGSATVNSLFFNGAGAALTGAGTVAVTSGLVANTNGATISNNLNFGTAQANFFTLGAAASVTGRVSGSGGLVKSGGSTYTGTGNSALTLAPYNTYTGVTTINDGTLAIADPSALGRDASAVQLNARGTAGGSGIRVDPTLLGGAVRLDRDLVTNVGYASLAANTAAGNRQVLVATGTVSGAGGLLIAGQSTALSGRSLTLLAGTNTAAGQTRLFAGDLGFASDAQLGAAAAVFDVGAAPGAGLIQFGDWITGRTVNVSSGSQWDTNGFAATLTGQLTGGSQLTKAGAGVATLNNLGVSPYTGGLRTMAGTLTLSGTTQFPGSAVTLQSGTVRFDNTGTAVSNRVGAQTGVTFANTGVGTLQIDAGANAVTQTFGAATGLGIGPGGAGSGRLVLTAGTGSVRVTVPGATGYGVSGSNSPSFVLQGDGLAGTGAGTTALLFTNAAPPSEANSQLSGTGAAGSAGVGILRGGVGVRTVGGAPQQIGLLTQTSAAVGARLLDDATEYLVNTYPSGANAGTNAKITANTTFVDTSSFNSLTLTGATLTVQGGTQTIRSGTILATGGASAVIGNGVGGGGGLLASSLVGTVHSGFPVYVDAGSTLTVNATLTGSTSAGGPRLVKFGPGTLVFDPRGSTGLPVNYGTNLQDTRVFDGTLRLTSATANLGNLPGPLFLAGGAASVFEYRGPGVATDKTISLNGDGGTLDLAGTLLQLSGTGDTLTRAAAGNYGVGRLTAGTLVLGGGAASVQPSTFEGGFFLTGGTLALNAVGTLGAAGPLGTGTLRLNGGVLAPLYATREVGVPVEVPLGQNPTFSNNLNLSGSLAALTADTSNAGLNFLAPVRLMGSSTFTSNLTGGGAVTFSGSVYDSPYAAPATLTLAGTPSGPFNLNGAAVHRGGTVVSANTLVSAGNTVGSATGSGPVTVQAGGTLRSAAGTAAGFIVPAPGGTVTVNGTLAPGQGVGSNGILTVGAPDRTVTVDLSGATSRYQFELSATNGGSLTAVNDGSSTTAVGVGNNFLRVRSDGTAGSSLSFNPATFGVVSTAGLANFDNSRFYSWQVADLTGGALTAGAPAFDTSAFNNATGGGTFNLSVVGQNLYLNFTPVPEPATVLAVAGLGLVAAGRLRRAARGGRS